LLNHFVLASVSAVLAQAPSPIKIRHPTLDLPENPEILRYCDYRYGLDIGRRPVRARFRASFHLQRNPVGEHSDLAPDDENNTAGKIVQTWNLKDYRRMNIYLRCRWDYLQGRPRELHNLHPHLHAGQAGEVPRQIQPALPLTSSAIVRLRDE